MAGKLQELWEAQLGATVLWAPVALTFGIWAYFALPQEPALPVTGFFLITAVLMFWKARVRMGMVLLAILLSGFCSFVFSLFPIRFSRQDLANTVYLGYG